MNGSAARMFSFVVLLGIVILFAVLSYEVLSAFILPMFLAVLLVLMFKPLHEWFRKVCKGRDRLAAGLTAVAVFLIVMLPLAWVVGLASIETVNLIRSLDQDEVANRVVAVINKINSQLPEGVRIAFAEEDVQTQFQQLSAAAWGKVQDFAGSLYRGAAQFLSALIGLIVSMAVMMLSLYYFLADGPVLLAAFTSLAPLQESQKQQLLEKFSTIARAVIVALLASAVMQGVLAGIGYYFCGLNNVFLLTLLTALFAMVPFVGATIIWVPCVLWLFFYESRPTPAIILAVYAVLVVSMADNLIKPMILQGQSNLHPLLGLLSVLGGAAALGPIGILVGPMAVALLQTAIYLLRQEMSNLDGVQSG